MIWLFVLVMMITMELPGWLWWLWLLCVGIRWAIVPKRR